MSKLSFVFVFFVLAFALSVGLLVLVEVGETLPSTVNTSLLESSVVHPFSLLPVWVVFAVLVVVTLLVLALAVITWVQLGIIKKQEEKER